MAEASNLPPARTNRAHLDLLKKLTEAVAVSGDEGAVRQIVKDEIGDSADSLEVDALGNVLVTRRGQGRNRVRVMLAAHMDEVGFMITSIDSDGYLRFEKVGGLNSASLPGKPVWIGSKRTLGVIGAKPVHLARSEELRKPVDLESLRIDIGAGSKEAAQRSVKPGDRGTFATEFQRVGPHMTAKALDDRLGVATLVELLKNPPAGIDLLAAFTVQEEVGLRGAYVAAYRLDPQAAIALDCTPAKDLPTWDGDENAEYNAVLGSGPAIYISDARTIGDPRLIKHLVGTAEELRIPYQIRQPGGGGTDAGAIHLSREGIPSLSVSVPARYIHTPVSIARLNDWRQSVRLLHAALSRLGPAVLR